MSDSKPKSALEIAMERLRKLEGDEGGAPAPLSDAQKAAIAEARNLAEARLAEREVMHRSQRMAAADPVAREKLDEEYRVDRARITADRDGTIERIKRGET